jgi:dihydrolipoamide dehydrogenase
MPSKLLIAAAERARAVRDAGAFGIRVGDWQIDGAAVFERLRSLRNDFVHSMVLRTELLPSERRLSGSARFLDAGRVDVGGEEIGARAIVIATGSTPFVPPPFRAARDRLFTSSDIFELESLPQSLAVVGTGAIGIELGQAMHALGVDVQFFSNGPSIGILTDPVLQAGVRSLLQDGYQFHLDATVHGAIRESEGTQLRWTNADGSEEQDVFDCVLVAAGRRPNVRGLELAQCGLALNDAGNPIVNEKTMQWADSGIFVAGDANDHRPLLHEAADEGRIAGRNAARFPETIAENRRTPLAIVFSYPQMATVGDTWKSLKNTDIAIGEVSFADQGRARVIAENHGALRVYVCKRTGRVLGAEMFAPQAEHLAHLLALAVQRQLSVSELLEMPVYHPVLEEGLRKALLRTLTSVEMAQPVPPTVCAGD